MMEWIKRRPYRTGSKWAFLRWTEVETGYLERLHVVGTPWFSICVHWLLKPDGDSFLHDHPVDFLSVILRGAYAEIRADGKLYLRRFWNFIRARDYHSIVYVRPRTVTVCLMGPRRQTWGFLVPGFGKLPWRQYYELKAALRLATQRAGEA